ncbi:K02A2.6-like [Cordylochernes scorpioides]|uniref:K02A2.6-like n=1 Tax=Cordylochernes scorpioides TaxID=51811 RepID=A0ABY6KAW3_9ARAC|nr:K02A2.6-like [Cordylochernes scorpioides]
MVAGSARKRRKEIMSEFHNHMLNGHLGVARPTHRLKNKYYWPFTLKDVSEFVKTCHLCQSRKGSNKSPSGLLQPNPPANYPFERIGIDFVGPLPLTKRRRKWIIVLTDYYTKYAETKAVSEATQLTERLNRTLINMISMYVNTDQKNWDEILSFITHAYNTTIQETTGYFPFFLLFGRKPMSLLNDENILMDSNMNDYDEYIENHLDKIARTRQCGNPITHPLPRLPSTFHLGITTEPVKVDRITEDSSMQRMTEVRDDYVADALTNMQPHCDDLVGHLADAMRGQAVPRADEAIISSFDGSHATINLLPNSHLQRSTPASISHFKNILRLLNLENNTSLLSSYCRAGLLRCPLQKPIQIFLYSSLRHYLSHTFCLKQEPKKAEKVRFWPVVEVEVFDKALPPPVTASTTAERTPVWVIKLCRRTRKLQRRCQSPPRRPDLTSGSQTQACGSRSEAGLEQVQCEAHRGDRPNVGEPDPSLWLQKRGWAEAGPLLKPVAQEARLGWSRSTVRPTEATGPNVGEPDPSLWLQERDWAGAGPLSETGLEQVHCGATEATGPNVKKPRLWLQKRGWADFFLNGFKIDFNKFSNRVILQSMVAGSARKRRKEIMSEFHNHMLNGHLGVARPTHRLKNKYYWPFTVKDVSEFVKTCHLCQSRKGSNKSPSGLLQPNPPANYPFERIGIDFVGPLPLTKRRRKWIIVLTDYYTKYAETKAVSEATVKEVSTFLIEQFLLCHGAPRFLISDRGSQFTSNLMKEVMKMCKCGNPITHPLPRLPSTFHLGITTEPVKVDRITEDSSMQRMTEVRDDYVADALTNMQPHCDDLVGHLADAVRGQAVPRADEAIISSFDRSHAAIN